MDATTRAATNRAIRNIQTELEFLHDHNLLSGSQLHAIGELLPAANSNPSATPIPSAVSPPPALQPPSAQFADTRISEKRDNTYFQPSPQRSSSAIHNAPPPPAYGQAPMAPVAAGPPVIASAVSLYAYAPSDAGDLALSPQDRVQIHEYMNADWAKGRNERTGQEGIFPRSYVRVEEKGGEKGAAYNAPPPVQQGMGYGNVPMQVATEPVGGQQGADGKPSKMQEGGKKFGKKLGNAAIFGAGATIGGNIVNSIF